MNEQNRQNIVKLCSTLAQEKQLVVTIKESGKGALIAGAGAFVGGLMAGPLGLAVGGTVTSIYSAWYGRSKFKSVAQVISEMTPAQKRDLSDSVYNVIKSTRPEDLAGIIMFALTSAGAKEVILAEIGSFLYKELQLQIVRGKEKAA